MDVRRAMLITLTLFTLWLAGLQGSASAAIHLDRSFGGDGLVLLPWRSVPGQSSPEAVAMGADGALILANNHMVERLDPAGQVDPGFGENGTVTPPPVAGGNLAIEGAAIDSRGRIVVVGTSRPAQPEGKELPLHLNTISQPYEAARTDARILRYLPNGTLDPSFGEGGVVETDFGLPTPEYEGVKLSSGPVVEVTGVAVDGAGRIVVTGGAAGSAVTACYHDDYAAHISSVAFVARLTESGSLDAGFGSGGVFGGRSVAEIPLGMEEAGEPVIAANDGVVFQRGGWGHCARRAGGLGFVWLTPAGKVFDASRPRGKHRVFDATAAPDGSVALLLGPPKANPEAPYAVEKLRPNGSPDPAFGKAGKVTLHLPGESYASRVRVTAEGEVLVEAVKVPPSRKGERARHWWSRFSLMLIGLRADGAPDTQVGPKGVFTKHLPRYYGGEGLWLDGRGRPTITTGYRPEDGPPGFAAVRFTFER